MEQLTKVQAEDGKQEIVVTREFALPLGLLFRAFEDPELFEQWMGTKVLKMDNRKHGAYAFETSYNGNVVFRANGTIHEFVQNERLRELLRWKIHLSRSSLNTWNLRSWTRRPAG